MKGKLFWCLALLILTACERSPYAGYKQIGQDVHLRLYMLGDGERLPRDGDSVLMRLRLSEVEAASGSLFSTEQWYAVEDLRVSVYNELLIRMHEGDSMAMITTAGRIPWEVLMEERAPTPALGHAMVRTEASMIQVRTAAMIQADRDRLREEDPMAHEQQLTFSFLDRLGSNWIQWGESLVHYTLQGVAVDTNAVKPGDVVTISYIGKRIEDGGTFDSTENNGGPLTFRFGDQGQVIRGIEVAVSLLREGQEGDFFLPSEYAFGARGVEGMIGPYTPVLYTVRIEDVQRKVAPSRGTGP